jgi:hypothetical protein
MTLTLNPARAKRNIEVIGSLAPDNMDTYVAPLHHNITSDVKKKRRGAEISMADLQYNITKQHYNRRKEKKARRHPSTILNF